ncbi:hypothetical protein V3C99_018079 [Haemonchus contortus]|uniref:Phlebovirus_G2 domain-containing protein n=1 Tax=Haemonchus contortus TaxID=6289 RepID=A0A7I4Z2Q1_HAECO
MKDNRKGYLHLYTCLMISAIHLEVVEDMPAGAFLNRFKEFVARRGVSKLANNSLCIIRIERLLTELSCFMRIVFFMRDTKIEVLSATRRAQMGSCRNDICSKISYDSEIDAEKQAELGNNSSLMDELDVAVHIEPLAEAVRDLKEQPNVVAIGLNSKIDALAHAFKPT